jgi:hypothetical protein
LHCADTRVVAPTHVSSLTILVPRTGFGPADDATTGSPLAIA